MLNNGYNLFGVHCVEEGDRIPPLQSYGQALKQKDCFSGVLCDDCGAFVVVGPIIIIIIITIIISGGGGGGGAGGNSEILEKE